MNLLRRLRATATVMVAVTAVLALTVAAAFAQYPPQEQMTVIGPETVVAGEDAEFHVTGAEPGEQVDVTTTVDGAVVYSETHTADDAGQLSFVVSIPADAPPGSTGQVVVEGDETATHEFTVVAADEDVTPVDEEVTPVDTADDRLPVTGGQLLLLSVVGLALIGGGALALRKRGDSVA